MELEATCSSWLRYCLRLCRVSQGRFTISRSVECEAVIGECDDSLRIAEVLVGVARAMGLKVATCSSAVQGVFMAFEEDRAGVSDRHGV